MKRAFAVFTAATILVSGAVGHEAFAQDKEIERAVSARQSLMTLFSFNLGPLGEMAKGQMDYDAETATTAAENLAALAKIDQSGMWPEGSGTEALGDETEALRVIWENHDDFTEKRDALEEATAEFASAAGQDLDALRAGIGAVGDACGACHEDFRKSDD